MNFKNQVISVNNGTNIAVADDYAGPTADLDVVSVPTNAVVLGNDPQRELAVRLITGSSLGMAVLESQVLVNAGSRAAGMSPDEMMAQGAALRQALVTAHAEDNIVNAPANYGYPTIRSFLVEDADPAMLAYLTALCQGETGPTQAYNGVKPEDTRLSEMGHDGLFLVYTDDEAQAQAVGEAASRTETMVEASPHGVQKYIDATSVAFDMIKPENGGRGGLLANFDGIESKVPVLGPNGTAVDYFVYRQS